MNFNYKKILFLIDGISDSSKLWPISDKILKKGFQINIVGFYNSNKINKNKTYLKHLKKFVSSQCFFSKKLIQYDKIYLKISK